MTTQEQQLLIVGLLYQKRIKLSFDIKVSLLDRIEFILAFDIRRMTANNWLKTFYSV
jgi:hypothetical protein